MAPLLTLLPKIAAAKENAKAVDLDIAWDEWQTAQGDCPCSVSPGWWHRFRPGRFIQAGLNRMRPIAMTTVAGIVALAPLAFGIGEGSAMLQPLAIAIIAGLIVILSPEIMLTVESMSPESCMFTSSRGPLIDNDWSSSRESRLTMPAER